VHPTRWDEATTKNGVKPFWHLLRRGHRLDQLLNDDSVVDADVAGVHLKCGISSSKRCQCVTSLSWADSIRVSKRHSSDDNLMFPTLTSMYFAYMYVYVFHICIFHIFDRACTKICIPFMYFRKYKQPTQYLLHIPIYQLCQIHLRS
jgi:hypothetical protein